MYILDLDLYLSHFIVDIVYLSLSISISLYPYLYLYLYLILYLSKFVFSL